MPQKRNLRQTQDPITWKTLLICQHIVNTVQLLRNENIWFASLNLDVPLVPLYDISKSPDTGSSNPIWKFWTNRKNKPFLDKYTQCNLVENEHIIDSVNPIIDSANTSGYNNVSDSSNTSEYAKTNNMKVIKDIPKSDKNVSINSVKATNEVMKVNNIPENMSTQNSMISEINLESDKVTTSEVILNKDQQNQTELSNELPEIIPDSDKESANKKSDNDANIINGCGSLSATADLVTSQLTMNHNIMTTQVKTNTGRLIEEINPLTATKDMGIQQSGMTNAYNLSPKTSTPINSSNFGKMPENSKYMRELLNTNKEILEAVLGIHKTVLRRLPKSNNKKKITKKNRFSPKNKGSINFSSFMKDIITQNPEDISNHNTNKDVILTDTTNSNQAVALSEHNILKHTQKLNQLSTISSDAINKPSHIPDLTSQISNLTEKVITGIPFSYPTSAIPQEDILTNSIATSKKLGPPPGFKEINPISTIGTKPESPTYTSQTKTLFNWPQFPATNTYIPAPTKSVWSTNKQTNITNHLPSPINIQPPANIPDSEAVKITNNNPVSNYKTFTSYQIASFPNYYNTLNQLQTIPKSSGIVQTPHLHPVSKLLNPITNPIVLTPNQNVTNLQVSGQCKPDQDSYQPNHSQNLQTCLPNQIVPKHVPATLSLPVSRLLNPTTTPTTVVTNNNFPNPLETLTNKPNQHSYITNHSPNFEAHVSKPSPTPNTDQIIISQHLSSPVPNLPILNPTTLPTPVLIDVVENWLKTAKNDVQNSIKENMKEKNENETPEHQSNINRNGLKVLHAKKLKLNQVSANSHTQQQNCNYNHDYEKSKIRGSRPNSPRGYSRRRADSQSSSKPQSRHVSPKRDQRKAPSNREYLNPQRYWESDKTVPQNHQSNYKFQNQNNSNHPYRNHMSYHQQNQEKRNEQNYQQRPNHIQETSRRLTTIETDGTSYQIMATSIEHDGEQVYTKSVEEIKEDKLNQLRNNGIEGNLEGSKRPNQIKMLHQ